LGLYVAAGWWCCFNKSTIRGGVSVTPTVSPARLGALRDFPKPHPLGVSGCERAEGVEALGQAITPMTPALFGALRDFPKPHPLGVSGCERADGVTALCQATTPRMRHYASL
jgi:hypothetical protein